MALRALMLKKKVDAKQKELEAARNSLAEIMKREDELEAAIEEAQSEEEEKTVEEAVAEFEAEKAEAEEKVSALESEVSALETELSEQETEVAPEEEEREVQKEMVTREMIDNDFTKREDVQGYLMEVRTAMQEKRALNNVGLTIPEVMLGVIRENIERYSKLYRHVNVRRISGNGRLNIMGAIPEAVWTECCANLNELSLTFNDLEVDCFKVGGYFAVCNATLEDSDLNLANEIMTAIGQAIGLALDKAILYGRNTAENSKMPLGVVSRLVQTAAPSGYPATARPWADLNATNVISIASGVTGADLIAAIVSASGAIKGKYSRGTKVWFMNESTYTAIMAATVSTDAQGRIVTGIADTMPVVGGAIEVLSFLPDNVIIGGYFDLYLLAERAGEKFASSEHVRFLQDQTVMKGTARYDGAPVIPEAFAAIGINGTTPDATMTFAADTANQGA